MQSELKNMEKLLSDINDDKSGVNSTKEGSLETDKDNIMASKYASIYKTPPVPLNQEQRRQKLLQEMKLRRNQAVNQRRGLVELLSNNDEMQDLEPEDERESQVELMDVGTKQRRPKRKNVYANQLMFSEWFKEIPSDLECNWLIKLCPVGSRNLIVAHAGLTRAFNKRGYIQAKFQSRLPGGNRASNIKTFTILDCIYNSTLNCYFVLDVIAWNNCSFQHSETEFRFFWLKSKFCETVELGEVTFFNKHLFVEIESFPAELSLIQDKLSHPYRLNDQTVELDGVLFYHRAADYIPSYTPLFGWLKPFMIPEMLHVSVNEHFMAKMPTNYTSLEQYVKSKPKKCKKKTVHVEDYDMENLVEAEMET